MSGYAYDYTLAPARPSGWRSVFSNVVTVTAIAAVSAISGAVVALELMAPQQRDAATLVGAVPVRAAAVATPAPVVSTPRVARPRAPETARASVQDRSEHTAAVAAAAVPSPQTSVSAAPAAPAPQAAPPAAEAVASTAVPDSELTFAKGYSLRRAAREATAAQIKTAETKVVAEHQFGRAQVVIKRKPKEPRDNLFAQSNGGQDNRRAGWHDPFSFFDRNDGPGHNQAMAYGDSSQRRRPPQQQGGLFSNSSGGGLFGGLF
jgi:hypothetical protein